MDYSNLDDFVDWMLNYSSKPYSRNTVNQYKCIISKYIVWKPDDESPTPTSIERYLSESQKGKLHGTVRMTMQAIKKYCQYLQHIGHTIDPNVNLMETITSWRKKPSLLQQHEVELICRQCDKTTVDGFRDYVFLVLLYMAALKVNEAANVRVYEITKLGILVGQNNARRIIPINDKLRGMLKRVAKQRKNKLNPHVFQDAYGGRFGTHNGNLAIQKYAKLAEMTKAVEPSSLRFSFACHMLDQGADLQAVQALVGYSGNDRVTEHCKINLKKWQGKFDKDFSY